MRRFLSVLLTPLVLTGCVATQRDILNLSQQTDGMTLQVHKLNKIMTNLQSNQADLNIRLEAISSDIAVLNENLSENRNSMSRLSAKLDDLGAALGHKFSNLDSSIKKTRTLIKQRAKEERERAHKKEEKRRADESKRQEEKARKRAQGPSPSQIYHKARVYLTQKKYGPAAEGFKLYISEFPKGEVADLATYYLGQVRYSEKKWKLAAMNFALVLDRYPKSDVTPAARLRYALSLMKMKSHLDEAKRYLESIPDDFPKTPEAKKAGEILRSWEKNIEKKAHKKSAKKKTR